MANHIIERIFTFLEPLMPYARAIVIFMIPIYITIGTAFAKAGIWVIDLMPTDSMIVYYVIAGVIALLGIILGVKLDPERDD